MAFARNSPIVFRNMDVAEAVAEGTQRFSRVLFLNIGVKSVKMDSNIGFAYLIDEISCVCLEVEKIRLKAVQRLDAQDHT